MTTQYREQRRYERVKLSLNVNWGLTSECVNDGRVTSISLGGCFLQTNYRLLVDQPIFVRFFVQREQILQARVRYVLEGIGCGVEFVEVTEEDRLTLDELIEFYKKNT